MHDRQTTPTHLPQTPTKPRQLPTLNAKHAQKLWESWCDRYVLQPSSAMLFDGLVKFIASSMTKANVIYVILFERVRF